MDEVCFYYSWTKIALHNPLVCFLNSFKWYQKTVEHTDHSVPSPYNRRWTWYRKWYVWLIHSELEFLGNLSKTRRGANMENTVWTRHSFPCCLVASVWMKLPVLTGIVLTAGCSSQTLHSSTSLLLMPRLASPFAHSSSPSSFSPSKPEASLTQPHQLPLTAWHYCLFFVILPPSFERVVQK